MCVFHLLYNSPTSLWGFFFYIQTLFWNSRINVGVSNWLTLEGCFDGIADICVELSGKYTLHVIYYSRYTYLIIICKTIVLLYVINDHNYFLAWLTYNSFGILTSANTYHLLYRVIKCPYSYTSDTIFSLKI